MKRSKNRDAKNLAGAWEESSVTVIGDQGPQIVTAEFYEDVKGICIANVGGLWTVTHVKSGLRCSDFTSRPKARGYLIRLSELVDWTQTREQLEPILTGDAALRRKIGAALKASGIRPKALRR